MLAPCCWLTHFGAEPHQKRWPSPEKVVHIFTNLLLFLCRTSAYLQRMRSSDQPKGNGPATIIRGVKKKIEATASQLLQPLAGRRNDTTLIPVIYGTFFQRVPISWLTTWPIHLARKRRKGFTYHRTDRFMLATFHPTALYWLLRQCSIVGHLCRSIVQTNVFHIC